MPERDLTVEIRAEYRKGDQVRKTEKRYFLNELLDLTRLGLDIEITHMIDTLTDDKTFEAG